MTTLTPIITEAAAALSVSPWVSGPMSGDRFGNDQALVERWMR